MSTRKFQPEQLERLYEVARSIHASLEPTEALQWMVRESVKLVGASSGSLVLVNPNSGLLEIETAVGNDGSNLVYNEEKAVFNANARFVVALIRLLSDNTTDQR